MIKLCGYNEFFQLGEKSNNMSTYKTPVICPPLASHLDQSSLLSYSSYGNHSVIVTNEGVAYGIGDNRDGRISGTLPREILDHFEEIPISLNGHPFKCISACCGKYFTLYRVTDNSKHDFLCLSFKDVAGDSLVFLNTGERHPVSLFGGYFNTASIDSEGGILFINYKQVQSSPDAEIKSVSLPGDERAVSVACCKDFIFALSSSGRLFQSLTRNSEIIFSEVVELREVEISNVSGSFWHCLAVSKDGKVFGFGANDGGRLGVGKEIDELEQFAQITAINNFNIVNAFAGSTHSLFLTDEEKVFACGSNSCGELFLNDISSEFAFLSLQTSIDKNAKFCIAGDTLSVAFIGGYPINTPNVRIK